MSVDLPLLATFAIYLIVVFALGFRAWQRTSSIGDYLLGGRTLGSAVTALSAGASDMSGWLLLGLPGAIYLSGLSEIWIGIGLVLGAYANWLLVAKPLRIYSMRAENSLTLPDYFEHRFSDASRLLRIISASVILLFFTFYTASGLVGGAILFENSFGMSYLTALIVGGLIIVAYTFIGGFLAVAWTDALQAMIMFIALIVTPLMVIGDAGGPGQVWRGIESIDPANVALFKGLSSLGLVSLLAWGLGYFGQPHILARFMAIGDPQHLDRARRIAMSWMTVVLMGSVLTGLAGIYWFADMPLENAETVFIALSQQLFNPWIAGVITAAILSAIMSTIDSQLLVSSSVISEDFYRQFIKPDASDKELVWVSRGAVIAIAIIAMVIASDRGSRVLDLVSYAWAGFGAAFGPVILFSLFWRQMTALAAGLAMLTGAITVVLWSGWSGGPAGLFDLYEIVPGFLLSSLVIFLVSKARPQGSNEVLERFDSVRSELAR